MAIEQVRKRYIIYNYSLYDKTKVLFLGEIRYFNNVETFIQNDLSIIGNGSSQIQFLPFRETIIIETSTSISIENLRISGNKVLLQNTGSSTIQINIGTTASPVYIDLQVNIVIYLKYNGTKWIPLSICNQKTITNNYTIPNGDTFLYYKVNPTTNQFINITLPLYANNLDKIPFIIQNIGKGIVRIVRNGSDTINNLEVIKLYSKNNFVEIYPGESEWNIRSQEVYVDTGIINRTDWTTARLGHVVVGYDNVTVGTPRIGGYVKGNTSNAIGKINQFTATDLILIEIEGGGIFQNNEIINGLYGYSFTALINEPTGSNLNKDTAIFLNEIGDKIERMINEFSLYTSDVDTAFLKNLSVAYRTTTPLANEYSGISIYSLGTDRISTITGINGISIIDSLGNFQLIDTEDYYYRIITRIFY